jgi:hypothetical protein
MAALHVSIRMRNRRQRCSREEVRNRTTILRRLPREMNTLCEMLFGALGAAARFVNN